MTKDNPDELCPACRKFDRGINGGPAPSNVFVVCDHDVPKEPPTAKDYCACCEYPELLHMMQPRVEELEKRLEKLECKKTNEPIRDFDDPEHDPTWINRVRKIKDPSLLSEKDILLGMFRLADLIECVGENENCNDNVQDRLHEEIAQLEKKVKELEFNQSLIASELTKWSTKAVESSEILLKLLNHHNTVQDRLKKVDAKTDI